MSSAFNWQCPFCSRDTTITNERISFSSHRFENGNRHGKLFVQTIAVVCPNPDCGEVTLKAMLGPWDFNVVGQREDGEPTHEWMLAPEADVRPVPDYVPLAIRADYREAALIRTRSPKASATLARRCLQGMIRDFWGVSKARLKDEIDAIREKVDPATADAIDAVRTLGNIGAHMEKDINVILEVEPEEAQLLLQLIETLINEWYVNRHIRAQQMARLVSAAAAKK